MRRRRRPRRQVFSLANGPRWWRRGVVRARVGKARLMRGFWRNVQKARRAKAAA